jgi:hypothetical protein
LAPVTTAVLPVWSPTWSALHLAVMGADYL